MFSKPFKVKSNTPIRESTKRKLREAVHSSFPVIESSELLSLLPNKGEVCVVKILTHSEDHILLYVTDKVPILFEYKHVLYPSVYMLWKYPKSVHVFTTWPSVLQKLSNGADLMLPGVVTDPSLGKSVYGNLEKGAVAAVNSTENSVAFAVGQTVVSSREMQLPGRRGKCVHILHFFGDHLWAFGPQDIIPTISLLNHEESCKDPGEEVENSSETTSQSSGEGVIQDLQLCHGVPESQSSESVTVTDDLTTRSNDVCIDKNNDKKLMDSLLEYCILKALKHNSKSIELPVLTSTFYKVNMIPSCPSGRVLDVKKSTYRKVSKFLSAMQQKGLLKLKELSKGVESIVAINFSHVLLKSFTEAEETELVEGEQGKKGDYEPPEAIELLTVTATVLPLFSKFGYNKGDCMPVHEMRRCVTEYVRSNNLARDTEVLLDLILLKVLGATKLLLKWDELMAMCGERMGCAFKLVFPNKECVVKGKFTPLELIVEERSGNKKVTLINNLDLFGIDCKEFAHRCQIGVAASTKLSFPNDNTCQVMVQGNQLIFINKLLQREYKLPQHFIKVI